MVFGELRSGVFSVPALTLPMDFFIFSDLECSLRTQASGRIPSGPEVISDSIDTVGFHTV